MLNCTPLWSEVSHAPKERILLGIELYWERPTLEHPLRWVRWRITLSLGNSRQKGHLNRYPTRGSNRQTQSERDRKFRNEQLENMWINKCQMNEAEGILRGDRPWRFCDTKAVSLTYLSLGTEGRRIFGSQEPTIQIDQISTMDL